MTWPSQPDVPPAATPAVTSAQVKPVSPALPIVATVVWLLVSLVLAVPAMMSFMAFDAGPSLAANALVFGLWGTILGGPLCAVAGWVAWGLTRRRRGGWPMALRGFLYLLPLAGLVIAIGVPLIVGTTCNGSLTC